MRRTATAFFIAAGLLILLAYAAHRTGIVTVTLNKTSLKHTEGDGHDHAADESHPEDDGHDHAKAGEHPEEDGHNHAKEDKIIVELSEKQMKQVSIELGTAQKGSLENRIELTGEIRLDLDATASLMPRMPGFVTEVNVQEGQKVKKGQVLAILTSHKLGEYYSDYNSALELEKVTKAELDMAEQLIQTSNISKKDYLRYKREHATAVILREKAEILLKSLALSPDHSAHKNDFSEQNTTVCTEYEIKSPYDGIVLQKNIAVGENFAEDNTKVVFVVSDMKQLWLDLRADNTELRELVPGMEVSVNPFNSDIVSNGKIIYVSPVIDEATRTGFVRVLLNNADGKLRAGEFATGTACIPEKDDGIIIPSDAVQMLSGETVIFIPAEHGFTPRDVKTGRTENGFTQILEGLRPGEKYVAKGAFELKAVLLTSGMGDHAGHGH